VRPKWLLLAPPIVWASIGAVLLAHPSAALDYFPLFWILNDIAILLAFAGVVLHLFEAPPKEGPKVDEWAGWQPRAEVDLPLEELLARLAKRAEVEAARIPAAVTSTSRR
jgi:hypothetical protein